MLQQGSNLLRLRAGVTSADQVSQVEVRGWDVATKKALGWPRPEAMMLIRNLTEFATQRAFVYAHRWRQWDLVMWDNRATMHRARPFDDKRFPRDMRRVTLTDVAPTLEQQMAA